MKRKLIALNLVLAALIAAAGWRLRQDWLDKHRKEAVVLGYKTPAAPPPPYTPLPGVHPVLPVQYIDVAKKDLFAKDRNDLIAQDPPPTPPPPPPMPPLPVLKGVLNIEGPTAIMSETPKTAVKEIHPGEKVGEFKLLAVSNQEIILEWNGQQVHKKVFELMDRTAPEQAPAPVTSGSTPAPSNKPSISVRPGPGVDMGAGRKACQQGDPSAVGTVMDGLKKVNWETPFGTGCAWEPVK